MCTCRPWLLAALSIATLVPLVRAQVREAPRPEIRGIVKSVDAAARTITVTAPESRDAAATEKTYTLAKDVEVAIGRGLLFKEGKIADLNAGVRVSLALSADQKTVDSILAEGATIRGVIKAIDATKNSVTISMQAGRDPAADERTLTVAADAEIAVDDGRGRRFSIKEAQLRDLSQGAIVTSWLSIDGKQIQSILAEAPMLTGTVKAVDAGKKALTVQTAPGRGAEAGEERTLTVANNALLTLDDGKGRRLSLKETKLENIPVGSAVSLRLSADQTLVMSLRAEGPTFVGLLKAVDSAKNTIVLALPRGRGEDPEQKNLTVAKDARINIDGADAPLANLKVGDDGPFIQVRMSIDQTVVQLIVARTQPRQ